MRSQTSSTALTSSAPWAEARLYSCAIGEEQGQPPLGILRGAPGSSSP